jgi:hypothetical protein
MQTWPTTLPRISSDFSRKVETSTARSRDGQIAKQRSRFKYQNHTYTVNWKFTGEEFDIFQDFFLTTLHGGADWFMIDLSIPGYGTQPVQARFVAGYKHGHAVTLNWSISAELELRFPQTLTEATLDFVLLHGVLP